MNEAPNISIAMATYNGGRFIGEQLDSFAAQTIIPSELVVTDDGSTDDTLEIVGRFARTAPFAVRVHRNPERLGYSLNFSEAVSRCEGGTIFLSDQDDRWFQNKIERSMKEREAGWEVVLNDQILLGRDGTVGGSVLRNLRSLGFPDWVYVAGCCTAISREFAEFALPFPPDLPFDNWITILSDRLGIRSMIEEPLQYYRRHGSNTSDSIFAARNPSSLDLMVRHGLADPRSGWANEIAAFEKYARRIEERREVAERIAGHEGVDRALVRLRSDQDHYRRRLAILQRPRIRRAMPILRAWRDGDYNYFAGWKSVLKDLIRP